MLRYFIDGMQNSETLILESVQYLFPEEKNTRSFERKCRFREFFTRDFYFFP